jgi:hypothetical protein
MTMKMISSTSITSTIGVTFMSDTTGGAFGSFMYSLLWFAFQALARVTLNKWRERATTPAPRRFNSS